MTAECMQTKRRRQGVGERKTKRKPTALRHLPRSKRAKAQHVQRERGAAYVVKQLVSPCGRSEKPGNARQSTAATYQKSTATYQKSTYRQTRGAFDAKERTQLDLVAAIRTRYLMRAPAIARHLPADRGERGARRPDRASTRHCLGALGVLSETRKDI
jgi:hypothetical protein